MATSFERWESDPLFPAAEVVQNSADRMESLFRLLQHERSLVQSDNSDPKLLRSIDYHKRDLATTLETAKWQIEDFEKAIHSPLMSNNSRMREDVTSRYDQFIGAIRQQILQVEKSFYGSSMGELVGNSQWVDLNEHDISGLASFLSGENVTIRAGLDGNEDSSLTKRFYDLNRASSSSDGKDEIVEHKKCEIEHFHGVMRTDHSFESIKDNVSRNGGSQKGFETQGFLQGTACDRHAENETWDLESNSTKDESFFLGHKLRGQRTRLNMVFRPLNNFWSIFGTGVSKSFTKRLKDGEEQRNSPTYRDISQVSNGHHIRTRSASGCSNVQMICSHSLTRLTQFINWVGVCLANDQRSTHHIHVSRQWWPLVLVILFMVIIIVVLVS